MMIQESFLISLLCYGFFQATRFGNILYFIQRFSLTLPEFFGKPICLCLTCMSSLHTIFWHYCFWGFEWVIIPQILIVASINHLLEIISAQYE
jgi:hypothetical protein